MSYSLQIQSVLYDNEKGSLVRTLEGISQAIAAEQVATDTPPRFALAWGDASPEPLFSPAEITEITAQHAQHLAFDYTFFNQNTGSALGHNLLAEQADTDYLMIANPDIIIPPGFFAAIMEPFAVVPCTVGIVEARQLPLEQSKLYDLETGLTSWVTTACAVTPASLFRELHGFDAETFFLYCDDVDYAWRVRLAGREAIYQSNAVVFHPKRITLQGQWPTNDAERYYSAEAALLMAYKWAPAKRWKQLLSLFKRSEELLERKAAEAFAERLDSGRLPEQPDPEYRIATFQGFQYSEHRDLF